MYDADKAALMVSGSGLPSWSGSILDGTYRHSDDKREREGLIEGMRFRCAPPDLTLSDARTSWNINRVKLRKTP